MNHLHTFESFLNERENNELFVDDLLKTGKEIKPRVKDRLDIKKTIEFNRGIVVLKVKDKDRVWIDSIVSYGKGGGTEIMKKITDLANKHKITLELHANPFEPENDSFLKGENNMNTAQLMQWYKKFGFEEASITGVFLSDTMKRDPK